MYNEKITGCISEGRSVILYKHDLQKVVKFLSDKWTVLYLAGPNPPKSRLVELLVMMGLGTKDALNNMTTDELKDKFSSETKNKKIVIAMNHFETITKRSVDLFYFFLNAPGVTLVCNYEDNFKEHAYGLFTKMEHFIEEKDEEINITFTMFWIIASFAVIFYLKLAFSISSMWSVIILAALWFGLTIFRTLTFLLK